MSLPTSPIPAPGFTLITGKRNPPDNGTEYHVQYFNGYIDKWTYTARQMVWIHRLDDDGKPAEWDIVAIRKGGK